MRRATESRVRHDPASRSVLPHRAGRLGPAGARHAGPGRRARADRTGAASRGHALGSHHAAGRRRSALARGAARLPVRAGDHRAGRRERLVLRRRQPAADQRRPALERPGRALGTPYRLDGGAARPVHRAGDPRSRRPQHAAEGGPGQPVHPCARVAGGQRLRDRHAQPRAGRRRRRRLSRRRGPGRHLDHRHGATRQRHRLRRQRPDPDRGGPAAQLHGHQPAAERQQRRAEPRSVRPVERLARRGRGPLHLGALRVARDSRLPGPRCERKLARFARLRGDLDPQRRAGRLGALSHRPLDLAGALGLDLGRRRALGLRAVSLRPLGLCRRQLGLGARPDRASRATLLRAGAGGLRRRRGRRLRLERRAGRGRRGGRRRGLVPARSARGLASRLGRLEPALLRSRESHGDCQQHPHHEHHQYPQHLRQLPRAQRGDGGASAGLRAWPAGRALRAARRSAAMARRADRRGRARHRAGPPELLGRPAQRQLSAATAGALPPDRRHPQPGGAGRVPRPAGAAVRAARRPGARRRRAGGTQRDSAELRAAADPPGRHQPGRAEPVGDAQRAARQSARTGIAAGPTGARRERHRRRPADAA